MSSTKRLNLHDGDVEILEYLYHYRALTTDHLRCLTGRLQPSLSRRLVQLAKSKFVCPIRRPLQKYVYTVHSAAAPLLVERGVAPKEFLDQRMRQHELKPIFLDHLLMVSDVHAALELATHNSHVKLTTWMQGNALYDQVKATVDGKAVKLPVRPDARFTLTNTERAERNKLYFFLEVDRSTTTHKRFQRKVIAYQEYWKQGLFKRKYGAYIFRIVTITLTPERAAGLCQATKDALKLYPQSAQKFYLFTAINSHFSLADPAPILSDIYLTPRDAQDGQRSSLIP